MTTKQCDRWLVVVNIVLLSMGLLLAGCMSPDSGNAPERASGPSPAELSNTVREYNRLLIEGFRTLDMAVLEPVATQEQAEREYVYMAALGEGRMRLEATLVSIEFGEIESSSTTASVETHEVWDYRRINLDTGALMAEETGVAYDLRYTLITVNGRWVVAAVDPVDGTAHSREATRLP